jgi:hypothetical protein
VTPPSRPQHAIALLDALEPYLAKVYPPDLAAEGIRPGDALPREGGSSLRRRADRVARLLSVPDLELYVSRAAGRPAAIALTSPPSIVLPPGAAELPERAQAYVIGEIVAHLALGSWPTLLLGPSELEALLAAAARNHVPGFGRGLTSEDSIDALRKRIERAIPRKLRKGVAEAARAYAEGPRIDFDVWGAEMERAARRVGLFACGDISAALDALARRSTRPGPQPDPAARAQFARENAAARDLLAYYLSDDHFALRRLAGMDVHASGSG